LRDDSGVLVLREAGSDGDLLFGQKLSATLAKSGSPVQLSKSAVSGGSFALSARADSAGLLYPALDGAVRRALKLRRVDDTGMPEGPVLNVANAPRVVDAGSVTAFGRGYAVVYRELPSLRQDYPSIRIAFVNPFGSVVYDAELARFEAAAADVNASVATSVAAAGGEAIAVAWTEPDVAGAKLRALRLSCPGALVLCGGKVQ
jgi:hypothetical protein